MKSEWMGFHQSVSRKFSLSASDWKREVLLSRTARSRLQKKPGITIQASDSGLESFIQVIQDAAELWK